MPQHCTADLALPAGWGDLRGFALPGDATAVPAGQMRFHLLTRLDGGGAALPQALAAPLSALRALRGLDSPVGVLADVTAAAAARGVAPADLADPVAGKATRPDRILHLTTATGGQVLFAAFFPADLPQARQAGPLHCLIPREGGGTACARVTLSGLPPADLPRIMAEACALAQDLLDRCT